MYKIIEGNNLEVMKDMPDKTFDMIFADPPYNMQLEGVLKRNDGTDFKGVDDDWDKFETLKDYIEFSKDWILECKRVLKDDGTMWVIGSFQNIYMLGNIIQELDFWIINDVIWEKSNPVPNFTGSRFNNAHETLIWFKKKNKSKFTFNYQTMKYLNGGKQDKSIWTIPLSTGLERLVDEKGKKLHNTQKPIKLLEKIVLSSTKEGDLILDPFSGTATTGAAAIKYKRRYVGIEQEKKYCEQSLKRLKNQEVSKKDLLIENVLDIRPPRVPILDLINKGYIKKDSILSDVNGENKVKLKDNGYIEIDGKDLSIHKASAHFLNKVNHNGWDYWYTFSEEKPISIDYLRKEYRKKELNFEEETLSDFKEGVRK